MRNDAEGARFAPPGVVAGPLRRLRSLRLLGNVPGDLGASLVVFLVAVPLSMGIAVASGAPLIAGVIAAAVGGIVAGAVGGSAVQVSGPAAGLTVIVAGLVHTYGWQVTCLITALAGVIQLGLGMFRVARAALAISPAVIHGMLAGVGVTISLAQLHVVLGGSPRSSALENIAALPQQIAGSYPPALVVGTIPVAIMLLWPRLPAIGRFRPRQVPAALVAVVTATAVALLAGWQVRHVTLPDSLSEAWSGPALPPVEQWDGVAVGVLTVAMVASVESLLAAVAIDRMHDGPRARLNRELTGQGAANVVSGALGGLPIAGVIVRSTTNVRAGARTPLSAILHGVWVLLFVSLFTPAVELIPMAALAGLLVFIGLQMVNLAHLRHLHRHREALVYLGTLASVVTLGLVEGVIIGFGIALVVALRRLTRVSVATEEVEDRWHVVVHGSLTFLGVPRVAKVLRSVPAGAPVDLDLHVDFMDNAAFESIHAWRVDHERTGGQVDIDEVHENWYERSTMHTPPADKTAPRGLARWWAPWGMRHGYANTSPASGLLLAGAREYHASTAMRMESLMSRLADGQNPEALFITCADSRVVPNLITASGPGDLFTLRNIGNLVPPSDGSGTDTSVGAAIEYAVTVLEVPSIVVCGHSHCGAMKALLSEAHQDPGDAHTGQLNRWLRHGEPSLRRLAGTEDTGAASADTLRRLAQLNVVQQLAHLQTYPAVRRRFEEGSLELAGLYYDLATARVHALDECSGHFVAIVSEREDSGRGLADEPDVEHPSPA